MSVRSTLLAAMLGLCATLPAQAGQERATFDLRLFGLKIGEVEIERALQGRAYEASGRFATTGLVGVLARVHFDIAARGKLQGGEPRSAFYREDMDTGKRQSKAEVAFKPGDRRLDPMSALFAGLGDRPADLGCAIDRDVFDGTRTHHLTIAPDPGPGNTLTCRGRYWRTAGYTPEEMEGHKGYDFTVNYRAESGLLIAESAEADTHYGRVQINRQ